MTLYNDGTSLTDASASLNQKHDKKEKQFYDDDPPMTFKEEVESYFKLIDDNGDGIITPLEMHHAMKFLRKDRTMSDALEITQEIDNEGVGGIKLEKFESVMRDVIKGNTTDDDLRDVFDFLDYDGDGLVSTLDLQLVYRELGENITPEEALFVMRKCDSNDDGLFDLPEFLIYCQTFIENYQKERLFDILINKDSEEDEAQPFYGGFG
ncbi:calmodulin, striated muscle isoform X1 [Hydra vulgaris]|uniref:calmodulin, striated muscle isoform X1 n=1 Tax=Hydra vulgaris TaxID=6087 RepID=UPI001F5F8B58|nr:calmodulin, striated muscle [Hydra vulgaris]